MQKVKVLIAHYPNQISTVISFKSIDGLVRKAKEKFAEELERESESVLAGEIMLSKDVPYHYMLSCLDGYDFDTIGDLRTLIEPDVVEMKIGFSVSTLM